jgi:hypothetical protein
MTIPSTTDPPAVQPLADAATVAPATYRDVTLLDLVDRLLDCGVVLSGEIVLAVAGIDLVYVSLRALVASVETARGPRPEPEGSGG